MSIANTGGTGLVNKVHKQAGVETPVESDVYTNACWGAPLTPDTSSNIPNDIAFSLPRDPSKIKS